jgi:ribosome-binding protein aMBF1 (putative translation factor)
MCRTCWALVPPDLQREVYRTVRLRGPDADASWAPWWRAQARAIAHVAFLSHPDVAKRDAYLAREMRVAAEMESERKNSLTPHLPPGSDSQMTIPKISHGSVEDLAAEPDEGNGEAIQEAVIAREKPSSQKLVKTKANKKPKSNMKRAVKARSAAKAKAKKPKAAIAKKAKPAAVGKKTELNPNGRKHLGPGGSPRGIRQDGKDRTKPGKNKPKSKETAAYGIKVANARHKKELTQSQLAAKMGISQPGLANIERGVAGTSEEMKAKFKKALGV